jgi:predicted hydrocarbon binding protein
MTLELSRSPEDVRELMRQNLRSANADDVIRDHVRVVLGPQPYKHNHFSADEFFFFDPARGAIRNVYGQRLLRSGENFIRSMIETLVQELGGEETGALLYQCGFSWGAADMRAFSLRVQQEYETQFEKLRMGMMLESWWWPLRAAGWGVWRYDFRHGQHGLILIDLQNSVMAQAQPGAGRPVCQLYAGLFAAAFSHLAHRELASLELSCAAQGSDRCRFLVTTEKRTQNALGWRDQGVPIEDILNRLIASVPA